MKLFGINIGSTKPAELRITPEDREWVESNFEWLINTFGIPGTDQILIAEKYFPNTFQSKEIKIENLVADCCKQLDLDPQQFACEIIEDIRDTENIPYAFVEYPVDCYLEINDQGGKHRLTLAKNLFKHPGWLIASTCIEFTKAKLHLSKADYAKNGEDTHLFLYVAAVYFGYGAIITDNLTNTGAIQDVTWETKWAYIALVPYPVMAYALAVAAKLKNDTDPSWKKLLPKEIQNEIDLSLNHINSSDNKLFDAKRIDNAIKTHKNLSHADKHYQAGEYGKGIYLLEETIGLVDDDWAKADIYNLIGYYYLRDTKFTNSISCFENALKLVPDYGYASDNLGFAFIMTGDLSNGKYYLEKALQTENNDLAYSYRNLALYHQKNGDLISAETYFQKAFDMQTKVDLLDYYYGLFLLEHGDQHKAIEHFQKSANQGEYEGTEKLNSLNNN